MKKAKLMLLLAGLMFFVLALNTPNVFAAEKTLTVKISVKPDFWTSKVSFPNGNKAVISGIGVVLLDNKGVPQIFKTLTPEKSEATFTYTGAEDVGCQINMPFLAGPGVSVYQASEKVKNNGQTVTYTIGMDTIRPLTIEAANQ